ncbi:MAG TPA: sodium:calcium antiporter, partial [Alphaproteobacteria bacterium]|nr:sodium:calcium antiporter [Alphaproteobacteria bacterium]
VGGIIGGNTFDVLLVAASDAAYREGSVYHAIGARELFLFVLAIMMTVVLLLGMLRRQTHGIGNIGFESVLVLLLYLGGVALQIWLG